MKNNMKQLTLLCVAGALFTACSNELEPSRTPGAVKVTAIATTDSNNDTRLAFEEDNEANKLRVTWEESGESFYVYVKARRQTPKAFTQTGSNSSDNKSATFTGTISARSGDICYAFYPWTPGANKNPRTILIHTPSQDGLQYSNNRTFMYAKATYTDANTPLEFHFKHLNTKLKATVKFPAGVTGVATEVALSADNGLATSREVDITSDTPLMDYIETGKIEFKDKEGNPMEFPVVDGKITICATLIPNEVKNLRLTAKVGDKYYTATLMSEKTLEAGKWYYPTGEGAEATELTGYTIDETSNTIHITHSGTLALYNVEDLKEKLTPAIDAKTGILKVVGVPSGEDLQRIGQAIRTLVEENNSVLLKVFDLSACTNLTSIPKYMMSEVSSLTEVILPTTATSIGNGAFMNCVALSRINLQNIIQFEDAQAFQSCNAISSFEFPALTKIGRFNFYGTTIANFNAPVLENVANVAFYEISFTGVVNLPKCNRLVEGAFSGVSYENAEQAFTLKLTRSSAITVQNNAFTEAAAAKINLVLNPDKQSEVTNGNEWKGFTFKSITFEEPKDDI